MLEKRIFVKWINEDLIQEAVICDDRLSPFLGDYLEMVSSEIKRDNEFMFDMIGVGDDENDRLLENLSDGKAVDNENCIFALIGDVGVGKTSFIDWWRISCDYDLENYGSTINLLLSGKILFKYSEGCDCCFFDKDIKNKEDLCRKLNDLKMSNSKISEYVDLWEKIKSGKCEYSAKIDINHLSPVEWFLVHKKSIIENVFKEFASHFNTVFFKYPELKKVFLDKVRIIKNVANANQDSEFEQGFLNQSDAFVSKYPRFGYNLLITCIISSITDAFRRPVWLILDNIDLLEKKAQSYYTRAANEILARINDCAANYDWNVQFRVIITVRPETYVSWRGFFSNSNIIDIKYPAPKIWSIAKRKTKKALYKAAEQIPLNTTIRIGNVLIKSTTDLADIIYRTIRKSTNFKSWNIFLKNIDYLNDGDKWHHDLTGGNVRRFVNTWNRFILSGNFVDVCEIKEEHDIITPSIFKYVRKLFRGCYEEFMGNDHIDDSGINPKSGLIVNIFEPPISYNASSFELYMRNYLIYMRIIQYLFSFENIGVAYSHLLADFKDFFDVDIIEESVQRLLYFRIIVEINKGKRNVGEYGGWSDIEVENDMLIKYSDTTKFYLLSQMNCFEYISTVSLVSYQLQNRFNEKIDEYVDESDLSRNIMSTLSFLHSLKDITINNFRFYRENGMLERFKTLFMLPQHRSRPWLGATLESLRAVKYISAKHENAHGFVHLFEELKEEGVKEFSEYIDYDKYQLNRYGL